MATLIRALGDIGRLPRRDGHVERVEHQAHAQVRRHGPADNPARPDIEVDGQEQKARRGGHVVDVRHPQPVRARGPKIPADRVVGRPIVGRLPLRGRREAAPGDAAQPGPAHQPRHLLAGCSHRHPCEPRRSARPGGPSSRSTAPLAQTRARVPRVFVRSDQLHHLPPELRRIGHPEFRHLEYLRLKPRGVHETGSTPTPNWCIGLS